MKPTKARTYWDEASWHWRVAAILVVLDIAGLALARFVVGSNIHGAIHSPHSHAGLAILGSWSIVTRLLLILVVVAYLYGRGVPLRAFGLTMTGFKRRLCELVTCLAVILPLVAALSMLSILVLRGVNHGEMISAPLAAMDPAGLGAWIWIFVVALPPFEELLYRGILHPVLRRHMGVGGAVAIGGLIFGLLHWFYDRRRTRRRGGLGVGVRAHVTNLAAVWISSYPGLFEALRR
jgi:membrane protease YdiL (CAAX protease family)